MIRRPPRSTQSRSSAASDVYKRQRITGQAIEMKAIWRSCCRVRALPPGRLLGWRDDRGGARMNASKAANEGRLGVPVRAERREQRARRIGLPTLELLSL